MVSRITRATERLFLGCAMLAALAVPAVFVSTPFAQGNGDRPTIDEAVTIEDFGFTQRLNVGARPAGMAGTYHAAGDDVHSLVYNPAGLARIRRIDVSLGFQHQQSTVKNSFYGNEYETNFASTTLDALAAAYPIPTYRGSLVLAAGVYRVMSSDLDLLYRGVNKDADYEPGRYDDYLLQQSGSIYSYNFGCGADLAPNVSIGANLFIMDGTIRALTQFSYQLRGPLDDGDFASEALADDAEADIDGYGMIIGVQYHPHSLLHFGLSVTTPIKLNLQGTAVTESAYYFANSEGEYYSEQFLIDTDYKIPFRADAGVSLTPPHLVLSVGAGYTDWRQAEINGVTLKDASLNSVFREVVDLRVGGEILLPVIPVRLRAGYTRIPYALEYLQADRIFMDSIQKAEIKTERQIFAAGAGLLIGRVLTLDASYEYQTGKRAIPSLIDDRSSQRVVLSGSYRF